MRWLVVTAGAARGRRAVLRLLLWWLMRRLRAGAGGCCDEAMAHDGDAVKSELPVRMRFDRCLLGGKSGNVSHRVAYISISKIKRSFALPWDG